MATIATIRDLVRIDLNDDPADRWSDAVLDRHIGHAVNNISHAYPLEAKDTSLEIPDPASREIDISGITGLLSVNQVEYPVSSYPKRLRNFRVWASTLELLIRETPTAAASLYLYYSKGYTVNSEGSDLPTDLESLCAEGAGAYAVLELSQYDINQVNVGGAKVSAREAAWAMERLNNFLDRVKKLHRKVKMSELYAEDTR